MAQQRCSGHLLNVEEAMFRARLNSDSFELQHRLATSDLFTMERIGTVAQRFLSSGRKKGFAALDFRKAGIDSKFSAMPVQSQLAATLKSLPVSGSWIKMTSVQDFDEDYREVLSSVTRQIEKMSGYPFSKDITYSSMTLFISSPNISTPFHIDHECNFLLQIAGEKEVGLYDRRDRELVSQKEIERFYYGNYEAATLQQDMADRATIYHLKPGTGVHQPPLAPHWVKTRDQVSISLSIWYCLKPFDAQARVHQANFFLRKLGLNPRLPGASAKSDSLKVTTLSLLEYRTPTDSSEVVFGPMLKLKVPFRKAKAILNHLRPH